MDLSLNKLPWYAQVGLFVALSVAGVAAFYYLYADAGAGRDGGPAAGASSTALRADISKSRRSRRRLPQFRAQVADLETRLEG